MPKAKEKQDVTGEDQAQREEWQQWGTEARGREEQGKSPTPQADEDAEQGT